MIPKTIRAGVGWVWLARLSFQHILEGGLINYFYELAGKGVQYCSVPLKTSKDYQGQEQGVGTSVGVIGNSVSYKDRRTISRGCSHQLLSLTIVFIRGFLSLAVVFLLQLG